MISNIIKSTATHLIFAFVAMGGWAFYANSGHPIPKALLAAFVQGTISATLTYFLKSVLDKLSMTFSRKHALWAPPVIACSGSLTILVGIHFLAQTPEILKTIAVPFLVSATYAVIYNFIIWKLENHNDRSR